MLRIAILMLPEPGHILPTLRVARKLQNLGHAVCYIAPPSLQDYIRGHGFDFETALHDVLPCCRQEDLLDTMAGIVLQQSLFEQMGPEVPRIGLRLASDLRSCAFDILVCDAVIISHFGEALCAALNVPVVSLSGTFLDVVPHRLPGILQIILCPSEFGLPEQDRVNPHECIFYAEPSVFRERANMPFDWTPVAAEKPLVYCSFGTQSIRYPKALEVLQNVIHAFETLTDLQLVVANRTCFAQIDSSSLPSNVHLVPSAPQLDILARASMFITHAGLGGIKESILSGVPTLTIPFDLDQPRNAERVRFHSLGDGCDPSACTPQVIRELSRRILQDRDIQTGVARMKQIFQAREMEARAAHLIENAARVNR